MRDKVLAYAVAVSVFAHLIILGVVGRTSAARPIEPEGLKLVRVQMVDMPSDARPSIPESVDSPTPEPDRVTYIPAPETSEHSRRTSKADKRDRPAPSEGGSGRTDPGSMSNGSRPGDPGGPLKVGPSTGPGVAVGPGGRTPVGYVPGHPGGTGVGPGKGPGTSPADPVPGAQPGRGERPNPPPPPPPPPPPDVLVKVCAESGNLPGPNCERAVTKSFRPGTQPSTVCSTCRKHVSTYAPPSPPVLLSGQKAPKYPASAREQGLEGAVTVEYTIGTDGLPSGVKVVSSSGHSVLDRAAVDAIKSRKYKPAMQAGQAREYRKQETFRFSLG